jgi:antitoxin component YwqK of YwqJK toxin-antitoxin module
MNTLEENIRLIKIIKDPSNETLFLRKFEKQLENDCYITYYLDASNNKHGEEKYFTADVGLYPGGYGWPDLDFIYEYNHGLLLSITHYINNYKGIPDVLYSHEYDPSTNESVAVYYEYTYNYENTDMYAPIIKGRLEYIIDGHFNNFNKDTFSGIVYEWLTTVIFSDTLRAIHLYENGISVKKLKQFYQNGFLKEDLDETHHKYNYIHSSKLYILTCSHEEYLIDASQNKQNLQIYYKFISGELIEKTEYIDNNKHGESIIYNRKDEIKEKYSIYTHIKMKLTFINGTEYTRKTFYPHSEYLYNDKENTSTVIEFYNSQYEQSQKMKYTVSGHYLDMLSDPNKSIKVGPYMEWYPNGALFLMLHYRDGKLDGPACSFYKNGQPNIKGIYKNGVKSGIFSYSKISETNTYITQYYNHDINQYINAIDMSEQFRGLSELDSWVGFPYSAF